MSNLSCTSCGGRVELPPDHARAKIRCDACGYYVDVPAEFRNRAPAEERQSVAAASAPAKKSKPKREAPPLIVGTQDEEDSLPYTVPGDPTKKCQACFKEIDLDATFCVHCGVDFASGLKAKKAYQPIDQTWEPRWGLDLRKKVFFGCVILNGILATLAVLAGSSFSSGFVFILFQGGLQAFLLGTYERLTVKRTAKGAATMFRTWRIGFLPKAPQKIDWKASHGVGIIAVHQPGIIDWVIFIDLLLCGILPGLLFYWYCIRPDRFHVALCDVYGSTNDTIFRTTDRDQCDEICKTIHDATGLWYKPVL